VAGPTFLRNSEIVLVLIGVAQLSQIQSGSAWRTSHSGGQGAFLPLFTLRGDYAKYFPEHTRRRLCGVYFMDQRRSVKAKDRLCFDLISLKTLADNGLVSIIKPVVLERPFFQALDKLGVVRAAQMEDLLHINERRHELRLLQITRNAIEQQSIQFGFKAM
jgi:hypothetical protein